MAKKLTSTKAKKILHDKEVHGHPLTEQQRKFFGAIAGGAKPYKVESGGWLDKFDAPQAQNGIEGTMGGLTDKGFNFNPAWGGAWRDGGDLPKYQTGDTFTPYSRDYLTNFRDEWVKSYNQPIPYALPTDDRFDKFYLEKRATVPEYYETKSGWVRGLGTGMEEFREGDKNTPPRSMGKPAKGYEWVENYRDGPFRDDSQIREYTRLIKSIRNAENRKPVWNRDVKFNFKSGGILQPPMAGANQTVPMAQKGIRQPIYTSDRQDPRLRAYQDSLNLYNLNRNYINATNEHVLAETKTLTTPNLTPEQYGNLITPSLKKGVDAMTKFVEYRRISNVPNKPSEIVDLLNHTGTDWYKIVKKQYKAYKKPVQPVVYRKRILEKPNLSVDLPNIELTDVRPAIAQPTFEQARVDMSKPTKYSYTYPTFDKDVQKTMYFPNRNSWKTFVEQQRGANSQEGKDYGSATGQFAMGGSLPGSVGFTYARTQSPAPANGPYAKKTKASAQNGQEMSFYQHGLDWTPRNISRNGGWLDKYSDDVPEAQKGQVLQQRYSTGPMMGDLAQQSGVPSQAEIARQAQIRKEAAIREQQLAARARYEAMPKIGPAKQRNYSEQVQAEEQRRRLNQQYADQNPEVTTDESGDIVPSGYGRFMQTYGPNLDKFARSWETPLAIEGALSLAPLVGRGVVAGTKATKNYLGNTYKNIAEGSNPFNYAWRSPAVGLSEEASQRMFKNVLNNANFTDAERAVIADYQHNSKLYTGRHGNVDPVKRQAINDIIQKYNINVEGDAIATRMFNPNNNSLGAIIEGNRLNFGDRPTSFTIGAKGSWGSGAKDRLVIPNRYLKQMGDKFVKNSYEPLSEDALKLVREGAREFAAGIRQSAELSQERELIGTGLDLRKLGKVKNDVGGYDWVVKPIKQKKEGGEVVKDNEGYWNPENWGKVVEIDSPYITMKGVDQPLVGVSDTGDVQYMMPGEDYEFDGEYVTEYPVAKKGISVNNADAQPLKKLDQLLNFTNYNKPTKGGWLDKYN